MSPLLEEVNVRWRQMFSQLHGGGDVPPGQRLRTEGMMEALVLLGELASEDLQGRMDKAYVEVTGRTLAEDFEDDWQEFYPFPQIPAVGLRAPVYPSTAD